MTVLRTLASSWSCKTQMAQTQVALVLRNFFCGENYNLTEIAFLLVPNNKFDSEWPDPWSGNSKEEMSMCRNNAGSFKTINNICSTITWFVFSRESINIV